MATLWIGTTARHRVSKNRKNEFQFSFIFFASFFLNNLNIYKGRAAPVLAVLQHITRSAFLLETK